MAHPGIVASALLEAAMLAGGDGVQLEQIELELGSGQGPAVGSFCEVEASTSDETVDVVASADGHRVGTLRAVIAAGERTREVGS
jgi:hypothetical protein